MNAKRILNTPELFEIKVAGHLSPSWAAQFEGLSMQHEPDGETVLTGWLDQAGLHGVLARIRDLGLKLISIKPIEVDNGI
ncbi:MAG: hypothetical protein ACK2UM_01860 [Anaerolineales bacterium]|jgi:hypothetical protein